MEESAIVCKIPLTTNENDMKIFEVTFCQKRMIFYSPNHLYFSLIHCLLHRNLNTQFHFNNIKRMRAVSSCLACVSTIQQFSPLSSAAIGVVSFDLFYYFSPFSCRLNMLLVVFLLFFFLLIFRC